jgi:hypothetical protein
MLVAVVAISHHTSSAEPTLVSVAVRLKVLCAESVMLGGCGG